MAATPRDVREIVSKLSSEKAKCREEGVKQLVSSWLDGGGGGGGGGGERSHGFCRLLARNTAGGGGGKANATETWPFLVSLLCKCVSLEMSSCKKRAPKVIYAKALRMAVQRAHEWKHLLSLSLSLPLFCIVKSLFQHTLEVMREGPSCFQSDYSALLRILLSVPEYRYQLPPRVYNALLLLFFNKALQSFSKEDLFRSLLPLHLLLDNPPADFAHNTRNQVVSAFSRLFLQVRFVSFLYFLFYFHSYSMILISVHQGRRKDIQKAYGLCHYLSHKRRPKSRVSGYYGHTFLTQTVYVSLLAHHP